MSSPEPVFVHSSFRSGSTWLWRAFRRSPGSHTYYEILHPVLARITPDTIASSAPESWDSRHPSAEPYFREFAGLLAPLGGVPGYREEMAYEDFFRIDDRPRQRYIEGLVANAQKLNRVPVLTSCRTLGRLGALKAQHPGVHVVLVRDLYKQWLSYLSMARGGHRHFWSATVRTILSGAREFPYIARVKGAYLRPNCDPEGDFDDCYDTEEDFFLAFLGLHLFLYWRALGFADIVIDQNQLLGSADSVRSMAHVLRARTGLDVDLSDVKDPPPPAAFAPAPPHSLVGDITRLRDGLEAVETTHASDAGRSYVDLALKGVLSRMGRT